MPGAFGTTARNGLRKLLGTSKVSDIDEGFSALADDVDQKMLSYWTDTAAKRPAAGQPNRIFRESDTGYMEHDTGAAWEPIVGPAPAHPSSTQVARAVNTTYLESASRWALVSVEVEIAGAVLLAISVGSGGVFLTRARERSEGALSPVMLYALLAPGEEWQLSYAGVAPASLKSSSVKM